MNPLWLKYVFNQPNTAALFQDPILSLEFQMKPNLAQKSEMCLNCFQQCCYQIFSHQTFCVTFDLKLRKLTHVLSGPKSSRKLPMNSRDFSSHLWIRSWLFSSTLFTKCFDFSSTVRTVSFILSTWFWSRYLFSCQERKISVHLFMVLPYDLMWKIYLFIFLP